MTSVPTLQNYLDKPGKITRDHVRVQEKAQCVLPRSLGLKPDSSPILGKFFKGTCPDQCNYKKPLLV
jgi:hypothetical protein